MSLSGRFLSEDLKPLVDRWGAWFDIYNWESLPDGNDSEHATCRLCDREFSVHGFHFGWRPVDLNDPEQALTMQHVLDWSLKDPTGHGRGWYFDARYRIIDKWPHVHVELGPEMLEQKMSDHMIDVHRDELLERWATLPWDLLERVADPAPTLIHDLIVGGG